MRSLFFIAKFRRVFCTKTIKSRLFKKYLKINTRWHPFVCILVCCYIACWNKQEARHWAHPTSFGKGRWFLIKFVNLVPSVAASYVQKWAPAWCLSVCEAGGSGSEELKKCHPPPLQSCDSWIFMKKNADRKKITWIFEIRWQTKTTIYLQYQSAYGHQTRRDGNLSWWNPTDKVKWLFYQVAIWDYVTN